MEDKREHISRSFDNEQDAAEALKALRQIENDEVSNVNVMFDERRDAVASGAQRQEEAAQDVAGPSYAMTDQQAIGGGLGIVVGAGLFGIMALIGCLIAVAAESMTGLVAFIVVMCAVFAGGTLGVIMGGRAGGIFETRREERGHVRRVVVSLDTKSPQKAEQIRDTLNYAARGSDRTPQKRSERDRRAGPQPPRESGV